MEGIVRYLRLRALAQSLRGRKSSWVGLLGLVAFVLVACTNTNAAVDNQPTSSDSNSSGTSANVAPDFQLTLFSSETREAGEVLRLSDLRGQPVVVNFWFPSCPPCVAEMPDLDAVFQEHRGEGLEMIGVQLVGLDSVADGQEFVDSLGITYALGPDENADILMDYKVGSFPTTVFIDRDQNISRKWTGILDREKMEELVQDILN